MVSGQGVSFQGNPSFVPGFYLSGAGVEEEAAFEVKRG
jgi:hypothetical protein